jgi:peptidoglycan/LPS O-acetylase OafA/YrhL
MLAARMSHVTPGRFRLMLASIVVLHHLTRFEMGKMAVYAFFVLSGYWISQMYETKYMRASRPYAVFLASRFWRLAPVFLLVNALVIATSLACGLGAPSWPWSFHQLASNLMMAGYASLGSTGLLVPAWSLDVELQFYVAVPLLLLLCSGRSALARALFIGACACGPVLLLAGVGRSGATVLPYLGFFALGIMAAQWTWRPTASQAAVSIALVVVLTLLVFALPGTRGVLLASRGPGAQIFWLNVPVNALLALLLAPAALWSVRQRSGQTDRTLGDLSYVVYLLHWELVILVTRYLAALPFLERAAATAAAIVATGVSAWLVWRFFDRPIDELRRRWVQGRLLVSSSAARAPMAAE